MPSARQQFGTEAEQQAADFLRTKGYVILEQHATSRYGEIDIVAKDGQTIVAVEVKARRNDKFGRASESITDVKLEKLSAAIDDLATKRGWTTGPIRIDVVTVDPSGLDHLVGVGQDLTEK